jgi:uncharacterized Tic20 family protein
VSKLSNNVKYSLLFNDNQMERDKMTLNKQTNILLYSAEGIGAVFVVIFLAAYLAGLPTTNVYHSDAVVKTLLSVFGAILLILALILTVLSASERNNSRVQL